MPRIIWPNDGTEFIVAHFIPQYYLTAKAFNQLAILFQKQEGSERSQQAANKHHLTKQQAGRHNE